jgi:uncharacterized protein involved in exopolysaccharide biosynthesis/Mrp family chromosome partitioning ATPase
MITDYTFNIAKASLRIRWRIILLLCILSYPFAIFILRNTEVDYVAQTKIFALPQTSKNSLLGSTSALFATESSIDRSVFLSGQEVLIKSGDIFNAVKKVDPDLNPNRSGSLKTKQKIFQYYVDFQELIFGADYVRTRQKWKKPELDAFKSRIKLEVDMEVASMTLSYRHKTPEVAINAVKAAYEALQQINSDFLSKQASKKAEFLSQKIDETRRALDKSNEEIAAFIRKNKISNDPRTVEPRYKGFAAASEMITKATLDIEQTKLAIRESRKIAIRLKDDLKDGLLEDREGRLTKLTLDLRRYEEVLSNSRSITSNEAVANLKRQLADVRNKIKQELSTRANILDRSSLTSLLSTTEGDILAQETNLQAAMQQQEFGRIEMSKFEKELADLPGLGAKLGKLTLVQAQERKILEQLTQRYLEAQIERDTKFAQLYITEEPILNDTVKIGKLPILVVSLALLTLIILVAVATIDIFKGTILDRHQLSQYQRPLFLGAIPYSTDLRNRKAYTVSTENGLGFRVAHALKRRLLDNKSGATCPIIAVTSNAAKVGKTVTVVGIATAMRARGLRPLVIDADYLAKNRSLTEHIPTNSNQFISLTELQAKIQGEQSQQIHKQKLTVFSLSREFHSDEHIHDFLSNNLQILITKLKNHFDCILIDCAPVFVPAMLLVYEQADAIILSFPEGRSTEKDVASLVEIIEPSCKESCKLYSTLTMTRLKENLVAPTDSDGNYYRVSKLAA